MDIIQRLPLPDEICNKIVLYAFKSPHIHLQEEIFKRAVPKSICQKLVEVGDIEINAQGHITKAKCLWNNVDLENLQFDIRILPNNLTEFGLSSTGVTGDIQDLPTNLIKFYLNDTGVTGDIQVLQGLQHLTEFSLFNTGVTGDIRVLQGLPNLSGFNLSNTGVFGDIQVLQSRPKLTEIDLENTGVTGDEEAFQNYRKSHRLEECYMYL